MWNILINISVYSKAVFVDMCSDGDGGGVGIGGGGGYYETNFLCSFIFSV